MIKQYVKPPVIGSRESIQRAYYAKTAEDYQSMHVHEDDEHTIALALLLSLLDIYNIKSILDVGSGTGRAISAITRARPDIFIRGVEPVVALREVGYSTGISREMLVDGDARQLAFADGEFDLVCEFGVLHHIHKPDGAISEMCRVARIGIFISDSNNFGQGSLLSRFSKQALDKLCLWPFANFIKTRGRGYTISEGDGLGYSYSVFNNFKQIRLKCDKIYIMNTSPGGSNIYKSAATVALLGIKIDSSTAK